MQEDDNKTQKEKNTAEAIYILCWVVFVVGGTLLITTLALSVDYLSRSKGKASLEIIIILGGIVVYNVIPFLVLKCYLSKNVKWCSCLVIVTSANVTSYLFCWLMIGIMINPTWGLTVALLVCSIFAALVYAVYLYLDTTDDNLPQVVAQNSSCCKNLHTFLFCGSGFLAVLLLVFIILFAGQSYNSKETGDEVLKTILLYFIGAFISWISWKKHPLHPGTAQKGTPAAGTAQNGTPAAGTAQNGTPAAGTAQNGTPAAGTAQNGTPAAGTAQNGTPAAGTAQNGTPAAGTAQNGTPPDGTAQNGTPPEGTAENGTPTTGTALSGPRNELEMKPLIDKPKGN